jgi:hypothetical protein
MGREGPGIVGIGTGVGPGIAVLCQNVQQYGARAVEVKCCRKRRLRPRREDMWSTCQGSFSADAGGGGTCAGGFAPPSRGA